MIKEHVLRPRHIVVAILALDALRAEVRVIFLVAGIASRRQRNFEDRFDMACLTLERFMRAMNFMVGIDIVIEHDAGPVSRDVAGFANVAKASIVIVIFEMT